MHLRLIREPTTDAGATLGALYVNGVWQCWTLEDAIRDHKVPGATAIPAGRYHVIVDLSARFQRLMPHVLDVPGFEGIRIHPGNTPVDTEGCILVGGRRGDGALQDSRIVFEVLFSKLLTASAPITLAIANPDVEV